MSGIVVRVHLCVCKVQEWTWLSKVLTCVGLQTLMCVGAPGWQAEFCWTFPQEGVFCLGEREDSHLAPSGACGASAALTISFHLCPAGVSLSKSRTRAFCESYTDRTGVLVGCFTLRSSSFQYPQCLWLPSKLETIYKSRQVATWNLKSTSVCDEAAWFM